MLRLPTATNWRVLADSTAQLVADTVLLLNLIEQGDEKARGENLKLICKPDMQGRLSHCRSILAIVPN